MQLPTHVTLVEVSPRDGLQNETVRLSTQTKLELITRLADAGLTRIEVGSFVKKDKIPQLADTAELIAALDVNSRINYPVLVPNEEGFLNAMKAGVKEIAVFTAASNTFCQHNIHCDIDESMARIRVVTALAHQHNIRIRAYISCVLGCPYEGQTDPLTVVRLAKELIALGAYEVSLGDTIGVGTPRAVESLIQQVSAVVPLAFLAVHFHDTYGQALANVLTALQCGITTIDTSVAGIGGCPYAHGAAGNVATEDVLYMLNGLGIDTGVNLEKVVAAGQFICQALQHPPYSKVALAMKA